MLSLFKNRIYRTLFFAQVIALLGTGLLTIALGLLAFDLAGENAGAVLGTAYAIKMVAYVGIAPLASALIDKLPRKSVLIGADMIRAGVAVCLPFIDSVWQIYVLIFILQTASATFTPSFQAIIPDILPDEEDYTKALSLSRLAYDLENLLSPALAGGLLLVMSYHGLFVGTVFGFLGSSLLVFSVAIPAVIATSRPRPFRERLVRGTRIYLATPRLRGLLALNLSAAAISAFVLVNTIVMVKVDYAAGDLELAFAMAAFGAGSMLAALSLPRLLGIISDRTVMVTAAALLVFLTLAHSALLLTGNLLDWYAFLFVWALSGVLYTSILTPSGRLLRRSAHAEDRPAIFAAQFALSHACWLLTYPIAGFVGATFGLATALAVLGGVAALGVVAALLVWPAEHHKKLSHEHPDLPADHPHFEQHRGQGRRHAHVFVIDDEHRVWPTHG